MKRMIMTAAVALLAGGAYAQSDCPLQCGKDKAGAKVTQVADEAKACSAEQAAQCAAKAEACADKAAQCAEKAQACSGEASGAAITLAAAGAAKGDGCCGSCGGDDAKDCAACPNKVSCGQGQAVSFESWRKTIPAMTYNVGGKTTTCTKTAAAMCEKSGATMTYVVNGQNYASEADAMAAHTKALNNTLDTMTHVSFVVAGKDVECPMTAKQMCEKSGAAMQYRVGPAVFDSAEQAVMAAAMARGMAQSVNVSYEVDGKATTCAKTASKMCAEGKAMTYVVGQTKTRCNVQADHVLASERVSKALEALEMVTSQS